MSTGSCPLCSCATLTPSWLRLTYDGKSFDYLECTGCRSLICDPMPSTETLTKMYDLSYSEDSDSGESDLDGKFDEVIDLVRTLEPGKFIDYGCGEGKLLPLIRKMGWEAI